MKEGLAYCKDTIACPANSHAASCDTFSLKAFPSFFFLLALLLQALFAQISDPECGILSPADDGTFELAGNMSEEKVMTDATALSFFTGLGRALAMALVSRTFVEAKFSPAFCKLLLGRPLHFLDLLHSNQELFQDLLKLMMLPPDAVSRLGLKLPDTTASAPGGDAASWVGRGQVKDTPVTIDNRLEYLYRKLEGALFDRVKSQVNDMIFSEDLKRNSRKGARNNFHLGHLLSWHSLTTSPFSSLPHSQTCNT